MFSSQFDVYINKVWENLKKMLKEHNLSKPQQLAIYKQQVTLYLRQREDKLNNYQA